MIRGFERRARWRDSDRGLPARYPSDSCVVSYQSSISNPPVAFRGDVIRAPRLGKTLKMRIRGKLLDIVVEATDRKISANFTFQPLGKEAATV